MSAVLVILIHSCLMSLTFIVTTSQSFVNKSIYSTDLPNLLASLSRLS